MRHMIRADVDGGGGGCGCDSDLESLLVFEGIGATVGTDGDIESAPSPCDLFFFFPMILGRRF